MGGIRGDSWRSGGDTTLFLVCLLVGSVIRGELAVQPVEWWAEQALEQGIQECPKCGGMTQGEYQPPRDRLGECGIIEHCGVCGWEKVHLAGRHGRPYHA